MTSGLLPARAAHPAPVPAVGLALAAVAAVAVAVGSDRTSADGATLLHVGGLVAVIVGVTHHRRASLAAAAARARAAEQQAAEDARRTTEERLRIARELHDTLGHHLSLINVQASAALHRPDPARSQQALATIKATSRETLHELRTALNALRHDGAAPLAPGLERLDELVAGARSTGLAIRTEVAQIPPLPPAMDRAAYRIVQEALTNVTRHAAATSAVVRIRPDGGQLVVEVEDDGRGAPGAPGNGILGMGERARAQGGSLTAGPRPDGGFRVAARLPLPARAPA
jgi:signal transduction histidine kinase